MVKKKKQRPAWSKEREHKAFLAAQEKFKEEAASTETISQREARRKRERSR
jgi:hypothetical protein